jgi:hypothetical protein
MKKIIGCNKFKGIKELGEILYNANLIGRSLAGIAGSNTTGGMVICLFFMLCIFW